MIHHRLVISLNILVALVVKKLPASAGDVRDLGSIPGSGRFPGGGRAPQPTPAFWRLPWTEEPAGLSS